MISNKFYVQMFSIHGLIRSKNMEMGYDADTGGQIKYVVELCNYLSSKKEIKRVDLFTRLISDKSVSSDYSVPIEEVNDKFRIVRIQCGGRKYIRKELLWPYLDEYIDKVIKFIKRQGDIPDIAHGHYADAGYVAMMISEIFAIPFVFTGHSLGRAKKEKLLNNGLTESDIIKKYKIDKRIETEEQIIQNASLIVTSTNQEIEQQYGMYKNKAQPQFSVIPPGIDLETFYPFYHDILNETSKSDSEKEMSQYAYASMLEELNRFFIQPDKPLILSLCRPDKRKNISSLIRSYGENLELQSIANLAIFAGIRKDISNMGENERDVLTEILLLMDKYDLYGKIAIPKKHDFEYEVPELYRIAAEKKGVFVNSALTEPFGLTLIESAASGLPVVSTNDGGPKDIIKNCKCGILINPLQTQEISNAIKDIITNHEKWKTYSKNGVLNIRKYYTWGAHVEKYVRQISNISKNGSTTDFSIYISSEPIGKRLTRLKHLIISDIDNTLIGGDISQLNELLDLISKNKDYIGFGIATGRSLKSAISYLKKYNISAPDIIISSVGINIHYGKDIFLDNGWNTHISSQWNRDKITNLLKQFDFIEYQEKENQEKFKISYYMEPQKGKLTKIHNILMKNRCKYNLIYSHDQFLDILPYRASKGKAIRYLSYKWEIPLKNFLVCGDSGNDEEMLRGESLAVVVGNYSKELESLKGNRHVYFAKSEYAGGIIEAIKKYDFIGKAKG